MHIYLSSLPLKMILKIDTICSGLKPNVLLTYFDLSNPTQYTRDHRDKIGGLILDCGAYSLQSKGYNEEVLAKEGEKLFRRYKRYLSVAKEHYDFVFSMDDRFDSDSFEHNLDRLHDLEGEGVQAVPVIHNLDGFETDYFIDHGYELVAIGQCEGHKRETLEVLWPVVDKLWSAGVKVHLFGMTTLDLVEHVPAYSCDSVSWSDYGFRGKVMYWNPEKRGIRKTDTLYFPKHQEKTDKSKGIPYYEYEHLEGFKSYIQTKLGLNLQGLLGVNKEFNRKLVNVLYFLEQEKRITQKHEENGIVFKG